MTDTTRKSDNVILRRRASDWQTTGAILPGGCVVLAFPGCAVPVVNRPRRGRLPASIPSLSHARAERQRRAEEAQQRAKRLGELESLFRASELMIEVLRDKLRDFEMAASGNRRAAS